MDCTDLKVAMKALRKREGCSATDIHSWPDGNGLSDPIHDLDVWAQSRSIEAVIWTGLPPRFNEENGTTPTDDQVVRHLDGLLGTERDNAEGYVRKAPRQIDTPYRRKIEASLGWTYQGDS
jgi:hypothetical protein